MMMKRLFEMPATSTLINMPATISAPQSGPGGHTKAPNITGSAASGKTSAKAPTKSSGEKFSALKITSHKKGIASLKASSPFSYTCDTWLIANKLKINLYDIKLVIYCQYLKFKFSYVIGWYFQ